MTTKLKILIVLNLILLSAVGVASMWGTKSRTIATENLPVFAMQDSAAIDQLGFGSNIFKKQGSKTWLLNDSIQADALMMEQLLALLQQIDIKRTLTDKSKAETSKKISQEGILVQFFMGGKLQKSFKLLGIANETYAQFEDSEPFVVHTPTHKTVLHEIVGLEASAWRNRTLLSTGWNSLKSLTITYAQKPDQDVKISFDSLLYKQENMIFYKVAGVNRIDSVLLFNYIQNLNSVRALRHIDNQSLQDSLQQAQPFCVIKLVDLSEKNSNTLQLYANSQVLYAYGKKNNTFSLLDPRYFASFLLRKKDFEK
jgi:hypothetical protein